MGNWMTFSLLFRNLRIPLAEGVAVWPPDGAGIAGGGELGRLSSRGTKRPGNSMELRNCPRLLRFARNDGGGRGTDIGKPDVRLHRRRRGIGRRRARQPAERGCRTQGAGARGGPRQPSLVARPGRLRQADRQPGRQLAAIRPSPTRAPAGAASRCRAASCWAARARSTAWSSCAARRRTTTTGRSSAIAAGASRTCCRSSSAWKATTAADDEFRGRNGPLKRHRHAARPVPLLRHADQGGRRRSACPSTPTTTARGRTASA